MDHQVMNLPILGVHQHRVTMTTGVINRMRAGDQSGRRAKRLRRCWGREKPSGVLLDSMASAGRSWRGSPLIGGSATELSVTDAGSNGDVPVRLRMLRFERRKTHLSDQVCCLTGVVRFFFGFARTFISLCGL